MKNIFCIFAAIMIMTPIAAHAATTRAMRSGTTAVARTANPLAGYNYNYMYPYLNNQMRTALNPGVTTSQSTSPINAVVRTEQLASPRRVVPRTNATAARSATTAQNNMISAAGSTGTNTNTARRVVARSATPTSNATTAARGGTTSARTDRVDSTYIGRARANAAANPVPTPETIPSARCMADYTECMNGYCRRENTAYNRCYCSAKLSQIDATYQNQIDSLIQQLITVQYTNQWSQEEMNEYWMSVVGKYSGENSWESLENALNIDWAATESRVRGQQAYNTGHEYCIQHLRGCYYLAENLRDAYMSQILRDCQTYEQSLMRIKTAAESILEAYK